MTNPQIDNLEKVATVLARVPEKFVLQLLKEASRVADAKRPGLLRKLCASARRSGRLRRH